MPETPKSKITKEEADYRSMEKCLLCVNFVHPNSCKIVEGNISPDAVSDSFALQENTKPWNKEFYQRELDRQRKKEKREATKSITVES